MAILFLESYGHYNTTAMALKKWSQTSISFASSTPRITASNQYGTLFNTSTERVILNTPITGGIIGYAFYDSGTTYGNNPFPQLYSSVDGNFQLSIRSNPGGKFYVTLTNGTTPIASMLSSRSYKLQQWHYLEWKITISDSSATGDCILRLDGEEILNIPAGNDLKGLSTSTFDAFVLSSNTGGTMFFDDIYMCDLNSPNNNFLGCPRIFTVMPDSNGNTNDFTPSTGSNFQNVDETQPTDDTDYNSSSTVNHVDLYNFTDISTSYDILGVQSLMYARKDDGGTREIAAMCRSGGVDYTGTTQAINNTYGYYRQVYNTDPNTAAAWTASGVNSAQFGIKIIT